MILLYILTMFNLLKLGKGLYNIYASCKIKTCIISTHSNPVFSIINLKTLELIW